MINKPDKCTQIGNRPNEVSVHCAIGIIQNCKSVKTPPIIVEKQDFKTFDQEALIHDIYHCDSNRASFIPDVDLAWTYFKDLLMPVLNKHAPLRQVKVKGRENL